MTHKPKRGETKGWEDVFLSAGSCGREAVRSGACVSAEVWLEEFTIPKGPEKGVVMQVGGGDGTSYKYRLRGG